MNDNHNQELGAEQRFTVDHYPFQFLETVGQKKF